MIYHIISIIFLALLVLWFVRMFLEAWEKEKKHGNGTRN